ncbi:hypothetical protein P5G50_05435 [Leifsonia sp. F6_8S_P_1B]|uniref:Peptidase C39-like domain-containing protein n=1 Tax=Leifsonia williamsii TaxID=3035919 RepID=A0ABT8KAP0_9MICO|nr:hypothetical protein [Leifsonia williamsii]MDN4613891.1 hypothetical protein [Leifsonia williamsii]
MQTTPAATPRAGAFPYESQWGDVALNAPLIEHGADPTEHFDWRAEGYASADDYRLWARNVCGLACLRSVLGAWRGQRPPMHRLVLGAQSAGALVREGETVGGLYYRPFLAWVRAEFGLVGEVAEGPAAEQALLEACEDRVFVASVSPEIRYPDRPNARRGGHLVLVHTADADSVTFHNPSGVRETAENARLDVATFSRFFAGRGFTLTREG